MRTCVFTGGGRHLTTFYGEASPLSLTPYPLIDISLQKSYPFHNPAIENGTVFTCLHKNTVSLFHSLYFKIVRLQGIFYMCLSALECPSTRAKACLVPRRSSLKRARKGRREALPMVPCGSSPVTRFALTSAMRKTKRLRRRLS